MSNALAVLNGAPPVAIPGYQSALTQAGQANIQPSFGSISVKGKVWSLKYRGELQTLMNGNLPMQAFNVVIVGVAEAVSKKWYAQGFSNDAEGVAPDCFSTNGMTPDPASRAKQSPVCATCPKNQWGSRVTETGSKGKACRDGRRIALVPEGDLTNEAYGGPVMLDIPPTSLSNFAQYCALLQKRGAALEFVVTQMVFNHQVAHPEIMFAPVRWLTQDEAVQIVGPDGQGGVIKHPGIERMLNDAVEEATHDPALDPLAAGGPAPVFQQAPPVAGAPAVAAPAPVQAAAPQPASATVVSMPQRQGSPFGQPAPAAPAAAAVAQPEPAAQPAPAAAAPAPVTTTVVQQAPSDLEAAVDALLSSDI